MTIPATVCESCGQVHDCAEVVIDGESFNICRDCTSSDRAKPETEPEREQR